MRPPLHYAAGISAIFCLATTEVDIWAKTAADLDLVPLLGILERQFSDVRAVTDA